MSCIEDTTSSPDSRTTCTHTLLYITHTLVRTRTPCSSRRRSSDRDRWNPTPTPTASRSASPFDTRVVPDDVANRTTLFGESGPKSRKVTLVGGNLPVREQLHRKFANSPAWMLQMAVNMRKEAKRELGHESSSEEETDEDSSDDEDDFREDQKQKDDDNDDDLELSLDDQKKEELRQREKAVRKLERREQKARKKALIKARPKSALASMKIVMPRDEELESDNSESSDSSDDEGRPKSRTIRPISRQMMRERAEMLQSRRDEIAAFLGMHKKTRDEKTA